MSRLIRLFGLLAMAVAFLSVDDAVANPYPVTSLASDGAGSLRESIEAANLHTGLDSIPIVVTGSIKLEEPLPIITDDVAIIGPGADSLTLTRGTFDLFRMIHFGPEVRASLSGVTVSGGAERIGAGIFNESGNLTIARVVISENKAFASGGLSAYALGGGIYSNGPLTLRESTVRGNTAIAEENGFFVGARGGGVFASGPLTIDRSTISENQTLARKGVEEVSAQGGGVMTTGEPAIVELSTISGNSAFAANSGAVASGGGVQGEGIITSSTVTGNSVGAEWEAFAANLDLGGASLVRNTIVSDPRGDADSCFKAVASGGFNLDEDGSCGFGKATDLASVIAGLEPLADNGGPTPTHALPMGSPAVDRGYSFGSGIDQRGLPRPSDFASISNSEGGKGSDIGAFELQVPPPPAGGGPVLVTATAADRTPPNTRIIRGPGRVTFLRLARFTFASTEPQSSFRCRVGSEKWRGCRSPWRHRVGTGKHVFKVRAIDRFGNVDPTPAHFGWRVKALGG